MEGRIVERNEPQAQAAWELVPKGPAGLCLSSDPVWADAESMKRTAAALAIDDSTTTIDIREPGTCGHGDRKSTIHSGLRRVACETCKQVRVDFVDYANTGVLFRVARLA